MELIPCRSNLRRLCCSGRDETSHDVGNHMYCCTGNESPSLVAQPSQQPPGSELHRDDRPQSHIDQEQSQVRDKEQGRLDKVAPPKAESAHEHAAEQSSEEDLFAEGAKRDPDSYADRGQPSNRYTGCVKHISRNEDDRQPPSQQQWQQEKQRPLIGRERAPRSSGASQRGSESTVLPA